MKLSTLLSNESKGKMLHDKGLLGRCSHTLDSALPLNSCSNLKPYVPKTLDSMLTSSTTTMNKQKN